MRFRLTAPLAALILVSACSATPPEAAEKPSAAPATSHSASPSAVVDDAPVLASTQSTKTPQLKADVVGLNRVAGKHLVAQIRLSNSGEKQVSWTGEMGDPTRELGEIRWASGIGVLDAAARRWLLPYKPADSPCLCSDQERDDLGYFVEPGKPITVYAVLPAPSGNPATTTIVTPIGPPMLNVPISDEAPAGDFPDPDAQQVTVLSHRLIAPSQSLDKSDEIADDGKDLQVSLSSDVLFAVDKATLTPKARAVLARTAKLIDASPADAVKVEGHADSSGNDAINDPLSLRRAQAVQRALATLLTRQGVAFQSKGYGSRKPLYSNDTDEGMRRNRRVTVTFTKPQQAEAEPAPTQTAAEQTKASVQAEGQKFSVEVTGLRRLPGDLGVLTYRITHDGDAKAYFNELHHSTEWMSYKYQAASNVRLTDPVGRRQYLPGRILVATGDDTGAYCACSDVSGVRLSAEQFEPGETKEFWGLYALPQNATALTAKIATFPPLTISPSSLPE